MKIVTAEEQRKIESAAVQTGVPIAEMVRRAGNAVFDYIDQHYRIAGVGVAVLCGKGGNAADGFVVATRLRQAGAKPIILLCSGGPTQEIPAAFLKEAADNGVAILDATVQVEGALNLLQNAGLIVDAVFGIGYTGVLPQNMTLLFDAANKAAAPIISIDIPSGIDADSGAAAPGSIRADVTLCVIGAKPAHVFRSSAPLCGSTVYVDIGLPGEAYRAVQRSTYILTPNIVRRFLPARAQNSHKYDFGSLVCAVGSARYRGAAVLCTKGALMGGAGLVYVASEKTVLDTVIASSPEAILLDTKNDTDGLTKALGYATAAVVGCGMPDDWSTDRLVSWILTEVNGAVVVDAGALDTVKRDSGILAGRRSPTVITPHTGEFARMLDKESRAVYDDRLRLARGFATHYGVVTVLKSDNTIVALPNGEAFINTIGNSGLAKAGSGDLLSGLIGSLCACGVRAEAAAMLGVYLHGRAANLAAQKIPQQAMTASIVAEYIPDAIVELEKGPEEQQPEETAPATAAQTARMLADSIKPGIKVVKRADN